AVVAEAAVCAAAEGRATRREGGRGAGAVRREARAGGVDEGRGEGAREGGGAGGDDELASVHVGSVPLSVVSDPTRVPGERGPVRRGKTGAPGRKKHPVHACYTCRGAATSVTVPRPCLRVSPVPTPPAGRGR